jgi:lysophospholipase L1-like esterase
MLRIFRMAPGVRRWHGQALIAGAFVAAFLPAWPLAAAAGGTRAHSCAAPTGAVLPGLNLPRLAARVTRHEPVTIVALGSSSTAGAGATSPAMSYPSQLADELAQRLPEQPIRVVNKGVNGEVVDDMLARLQRDVLSESPDLVIWQTGTNTVLRHNDLTLYGARLQEGIDRLHGAHIDLILMDPQYAPRVVAIPAHSNMVANIEAIGVRNRIPVFHRFAVMSYWARTMNSGYADLIAPDGLHMNDASYKCVAQLLAAAIADSVRRPPAAINTAAGPLQK